MGASLKAFVPICFPSRKGLSQRMRLGIEVLKLVRGERVGM